MKQLDLPAVALIFGGRGFEHDVSVESAKFVLPLIPTDKYTPIPILISESGEWLTTDPTSDDTRLTARLSLRVFPFPKGKNDSHGNLITERGDLIRVDAAIPLLHGDHGEDGEIQGVLCAAGIPFVGCSTVAGAVSADKEYTKLVAESIGITTARGITFSAARARLDTNAVLSECETALGYPLFVKPTTLGSSIGASEAFDRGALVTAIENAVMTGVDRILVEKYVRKTRELECAYLSIPGSDPILSIGEIRCEGSYDYTKKYLSGDACVLDCAGISDSTDRLIRSSVLRLAEALGIRDLCRFDFFECEDGSIIFNEVNTMPGFTRSSLYPALIKKCGMDNRMLIDALIRASLTRGA